jgi:hypothetical protein
MGLAAPHIAFKSRLMLTGRADAGGRAAALRTRRLQRQIVERALLLIQGAIDAGELFRGDHIGGHAPFELVQPLVIGFLERLEGVQEGVMGIGAFRRARAHGFVLPIGGRRQIGHVIL